MVNTFFWLFVFFGIFALGDIIGNLSKGKISSVFFIMCVMLVLFMTGTIPPDILDRAGMTAFGGWATGCLLFNMGTMIDIKMLIREWRTITVQLIAMIAAILGIICVSPVIGIQSALVAAPIVNGGMAATLVMVGGATEKGLTLAAALGTLIYSVQKFFGAPPASFFGARYARRLLEEARKNPESMLPEDTATTTKDGAPVKKKFCDRFKKYYTTHVDLAIVFLGGLLGYLLAGFTGINYAILCLILGAVLGGIGICPKAVLTASNSGGIITAATLTAIVPALAGINMEQLLTSIWQIFLIFAAAFIGMIVFVFILPSWKLVQDRDFAFGISMAQFLGFPATLLISQEIANAVGEDEKERAWVLEKVSGSYVVAGLASVSVFSTIIAGILVNFL